MSTQRFKRYPADNDSGIEWLGEIPAHRESAKMWRISRAISGGTPARDQRAYWDGEIPWVSRKDMKCRVTVSDSLQTRARGIFGDEIRAQAARIGFRSDS